jgi:hypothetical protein
VNPTTVQKMQGTIVGAVHHVLPTLAFDFEDPVSRQSNF